jgi:PAS domain S-box-containing protein
MTEEELKRQLADAESTIATLREELTETNREVMALSLELGERVDELRALNAMAKIANEARGVEDLLERAIDEALHLLGVDGAAAMLIDEARGTLVLRAHRGLSEAFVDQVDEWALGEGMAGRVAQTGEPAAIDQAGAYPGPFRAIVEREHIQSVASIPLIGSQGVVGVVNMSTAEAARFDAQSLDLLTALGRQIAVGVERARLHEETRAWAQELEDRVRERTAELRTANEQLRAEVADRERAEAELRASEERLQFLADNAVDVVWQMDKRMTFTYLSPSLYQMVGFKPEEWVGTHVWEHTTRREFFKMGRHALRMFKEYGTADRVSFETRMFNRDGELIDVEIVGKPLVKDGKLIGLQGSTRDISQRKEAQEELRRHKEHLEEIVEERTQELRETQARIGEALELNRTIIDASTVGITAYDASGDCVLGNASAAQIVGATKDQILDQNFREIRSWQDAGLAEAADEALKEGDSVRKETHVVSTFDKELWLDCRFLPFTLGGEPHVLVVMDDVTEQKRLQARLIAQEKLATLGRLAGSVSHELRNPLGAIKNAAYFLTMAVDEPDQDVQEALDILEREVDRSEGVIKGLLDYARSEPPTRRDVSVNVLVREAVARAEVPPKTEVVANLDQDLPVIRGDPDQLQEVFFNIAQNGIQAMPEGGRLTIESRGTNGSVEVSVSDTGVGIPPHYLEKIFEPLFTTKTQGIGLGLAIVKTLVEGHHGSIEVESEVGEGTTFTVSLPLVSKAEEGAAARSTADSSYHRRGSGGGGQRDGGDGVREHGQRLGSGA